jgi:hypothetical protein
LFSIISHRPTAEAASVQRSLGDGVRRNEVSASLSLSASEMTAIKQISAAQAAGNVQTSKSR